MKDETIKKVECHLFFELETVALNGRELFFNAYKEVLKKKDVELTFELYVRYGLKSLPQFAIPSLMAAVGKAGAGTKQIEDEALKIILAGLKELALNPGLEKLIAAAQQRKMKVAALSAFQEAPARQLLEAIGLAQRGVLLCGDDEPHPDFPRTDAWLMLLRTMEIEPRGCIALTSSFRACKGALTADMVTVALPDRFTAYQDFSGAHFVLDDLGAMSPDELIDSSLVPSR